MMDITIGQYFPGNSPLHKMDPRTKILFTLGYIILIFLIREYAAFILFAGVTAGIIALSRVPLKYYFKGLRTILIIMLFTACLNLFLSQGTVVATVPVVGWSITDTGIRMSLFMVLRLVFLLTGTSALTFTTAPVTLTDGLEALLRPFSAIGLPSNEIAMMMTIALRFIPTFAEEADKIKNAQAARGADFTTGNLIVRAKAMIPILVPLFVGAFRRADELAVAMEARCYRGGIGRTSLKQLKFGYYDLLALLVFVLLLASIVLIKVFAGVTV